MQSEQSALLFYSDRRLVFPLYGQNSADEFQNIMTQVM